MLKRFLLLFSLIAIATAAQAPTTCGAGIDHCAILSWQASPTQATCLPTNTPACAFTYNVMAGTTPGGEASTPVGQTSSLSFIYPVTLGSTQQTFYFTVVAQTTTTEPNGTIVAKSAPSNENIGRAIPARAAAADRGTAYECGNGCTLHARAQTSLQTECVGLLPRLRRGNDRLDYGSPDADRARRLLCLQRGDQRSAFADRRFVEVLSVVL